MRLVVFFSRGMSLEGWRQAGILDRELALYRALLPGLERLSFVTYGGPADLELARTHIPEAEVLANLDGRSPNRYSLSALWTHRDALRRATIFKTNQINGAWSGVLAKWLFAKPLVVRCGFLWADVVARLGTSPLKRRLATMMERWIFRAADRITVAAEADRTVICDRYTIDPHRVRVIPNFVDVDRFRPMPEVDVEPGRVTCVGRLDGQKNLAALIESLQGLRGVRLTLIGDGPLRRSLGELAERLGLPVEFAGTRPHDELPKWLTRSALFILPSHYEGNPKALVEAMACGVPVIGTSVPGIREILVHRQNGYVCGTSSAEIREAVQTMLSDAELRRVVSVGAVAYVRGCCTLEMAVASERAVLNDAARGATHV